MSRSASQASERAPSGIGQPGTSSLPRTLLTPISGQQPQTAQSSLFLIPNKASSAVVIKDAAGNPINVPKSSPASSIYIPTIAPPSSPVIVDTSPKTKAWGIEISKADSRGCSGDCFLLSYCTTPPTRTPFYYNVHSVARFQQVLALNEEAVWISHSVSNSVRPSCANTSTLQALVNAMADEVIPIFDGVNMHAVAHALWYDEMKKASFLQLSG